MPFRMELASLTLFPDVNTVRQAIDIMIAGLGGEMDVNSRTQLASLVMAREAESSTFIGNSTALPHARTSLVARLTISACVTKEPIEWDASGSKVQLVFLMAIPKTAIEEYLQLVRTLTHVIRRKDAVEELCASADGERFIATLERQVALTRTTARV
jgi:mannitol/fructose-specific phosphotransferase system IIA component (Ntr-type)